MVAKTFTRPFAVEGDKAAIPDPLQSDGSVSYTTGFGPDYEKQLGVDPAAKNIDRKEFNELMYDVTTSLSEMQSGLGQPPFSLAFAQSLPGGGYPKGAIIPKIGSNGWWYNNAANNAANPDTGGAGWLNSTSFSLVTDKPTTLAGYGILDSYNQSEINIFLSGKADKAGTLDGYGIPVASQADAEATTNIDNTKPMTALRVAQSIVKRLVQAGEAVVGVSRFATLAELVTGAGGYLSLCPQYILAGFSFSFTANGYIKLPTWLGSVIFQWATSNECISSTDYRYFPVSFPSAAWGAWAQLNSSTTTGFASNNGTVMQVVDNNRYLWNAGGTFSSEGVGFIFAIGR